MKKVPLQELMIKELVGLNLLMAELFFLMKLEKLMLLLKLNLLRFLESKSIERLGSSKTLELGCSFSICATNRDLQKDGSTRYTFRENDLYYRLNVIFVIKSYGIEPATKWLTATCSTAELVPEVSPSMGVLLD